MDCPSCTAEVADGRRFCPSCGTPQAVTVGAAATRGSTTDPSPNGPSRPPRASGTAAAPTAHIVLPDGSAATSEPVGRTPLAGAAPTLVGLRAPAADPAGLDAVPAAAPAATTPATTTADPPGATAVLDASANTAPRGRHDGAGLRERLAPAGDAVRRRAGTLADRYRTAPSDVRLALLGAALTVVAFLALPYAVHAGTAAHVGGRLWWRPLAAVVATVLLATTLRPASHQPTGATGAIGGTDAADATGRTGATGGTGALDRLLAAVVVATVGATEAGLVGLVSGDADGARIGYYVMLAGLVTVLVASVRAARRRCAG